MSHGERNCAFFTLTMRPVLAAASSRSVWRDEKRGNLQNVADFRGGRGLRGFVNVGENRQLQVVFDLGENSQVLL